MYTRCPHCKTIFEITAGQLRRSAGDVDCVACGATFDAVETLADDVTLLIGAEELSADELQSDDNFDGDDTTVVDEELAVSETLSTAGEQTGPAEDTEDDEDTVTDENAEPDEPDEAATEDDAAEDTEDQAPEDVDEDTATRESPEHDETPVAAEIDDEFAEEPGDDRPEDDDDEIAYDDDSAPPDEAEAEPDAAEAEPDDESADRDSGTGDDRFDAVLFAAGRTAEELSGTGQTDADDPSADELEFNAPEQTWTRYFLTDGENVSPNRERSDDNEPWIGPDDSDDESTELEFVTADPDEWQSLLEELNNGDGRAQEPAGTDDDSERKLFSSIDHEFDAYAPDGPGGEHDPGTAPLWFEEETPETSGATEDQRYLYGGIGLCLLLLLTLAGQLLHYNRDQLAGDPVWGASVRGVYSAVGATLYPDWPLDVFEVTGTEAIAGRTSAGTLDVLANVVVSGNQPVGLPQIRIVLNDRWGTPLASRVFSPAEYLRTFDPGQPMVQPGAALPVEVSVADPGTDALGYIVDVCLPRRKTGLECQIARDPFQ